MNKKRITNICTENFYCRFSYDPPNAPVSLERHCHLYYEIYIFMNGDVSFNVEGNVYRLKTNDIIIIPPTFYHFASIHSKDCYERCVIHFPISALSQSINQELSKECLVLHTSLENNKINDTLNLILDQLEYADEETKNIIMSVAPTQLSITALKEHEKYGGQASASHSKAIMDALEYINTNIHLPLTLDTISDALFVNKFYFCHEFKKSVGTPVMTYVRLKKMHYCQQLLQDGVNAKTVSEQAGFENYTTFYRSYVKLFGKAPSK